MSTNAEAVPTAAESEPPYEILELTDALPQLKKVRGLVIEMAQDTHRGWYVDYTYEYFRLSFLWLFPLIVLRARRRLSLSIWPGGCQSITSALTGGELPRGEPSASDTTYKISDRAKGRHPLPEPKLHAVHTFAEVLPLLTR